VNPTTVATLVRGVYRISSGRSQELAQRERSSRNLTKEKIMTDEDETLMEITMEGAEKDVKEFLEFVAEENLQHEQCGTSFVRGSR
jgi:hypothetical protein